MAYDKEVAQITEQQVRDVCIEDMRARGLDEPTWVKQYTVGYLCSGNSIFDLIDMMWDVPIGQSTNLDEIVNELFSSQSDDQDDVQEIRTRINGMFQSYQIVKDSQMTIIAG